MNALAERYRLMNKPRPTEGIADTYLLRPLGALVAVALKPLGVPPTAVSFAAVAAALWSAWHYWHVSLAGTPTGDALWGALALLVHSVLDSADGQLARLTDRHTPLGRLIDGVCDHLSFAAIYFGFWLGYAQRGGALPALVFGLAALAGAAHSLQSSSVEYVRLLYADIVAGRNPIDETHPGVLEHDVRRVTGPLGGLFVRWLRTNYLQQRRLMPSTAHLENLALRLRQDTERFRRFTAVYAEQQEAMLHRWWPMAPNAHKAAVVLAAFLPARAGGFWAGLGPCWFFFFDLALLPVLVWLLYAQRRTDARTLRLVNGL